jgi:hypothetical protein
MPDRKDLLTEAAQILAGLYTKQLQAHYVLQDAGVPDHRLIPWDTVSTGENWFNSLQDVAKGSIPPPRLSQRPVPDGIHAVLNVALQRYPGNRDLPGLIARWEQYLAESADSFSQALKLLLLAAQPVDTKPLRLGNEYNRIRDRLAAQDLPVRFDLVAHWATEPQKLLEILTKKPAPTVVHFSGHGIDGGQLLLEGSDGNMVRIPPNLLADVFRSVNYPLDRRSIRCVLLNACYSEPAAQALSTCVDAVIGTRRPILDNAAIAFAQEFYGALANGRPVGNAIDLGKIQMRLAGDGTNTRTLSGEASSAEPELVVVHTMKDVHLDRLVLGKGKLGG